MREVWLERRATRGGGLIGHLIEDHEFICYTLERPWKENKPNISCVPEGDYDVVYEYSPRFGRKLYELKDVPGRSECKFHAANRVAELEGCIAVGMYLGPESLPCMDSVSALAKLHERFGGKPFILRIRNAIME